MLKPLFCSLIFFLAININYGQAQKNSLSKEEATIKKVIENESKYFWARKLDKWKSTWVQEPYIVWTAATQDGVRQYKGWEAWLNQVEDFFKTSPEPMPYKKAVKKYDYKFRIYGNGAWVSFTQENEGTKTIETRIMEKINGEWKIAMVELIFDANQDEDKETADNNPTN